MSNADDLWGFISDSRINQGLSHEELMEIRHADQKQEFINKTHRESLKYAVRSGEPWTDADRQILGMDHITMKERARLLGRSYHSVRTAQAKYKRAGVL